MRWPWKKRVEVRQSAGGSFSEAALRLIESQVAGAAADASSTAAIEAASGLLSRAFAGAEVDAPSWVQEAVTPTVLGQLGRNLIRDGDSMHVIRMNSVGDVILVPADTWYWTGGHDPETWRCTATVYGPTSTTTWLLPASAVVFATWGSDPGRPYIGRAPASWASTTARLQAAAEKSLADESGGPVAQIMPLPEGHGAEGDAGDAGDPEDDPMAALRADIAKARGKAVFVETTASGFGDGAAASPQRDWVANRLGPDPPVGLVKVADMAFQRVLAATGTPPSLFVEADGTSQREAIRRWHLGTVLPLAKIVAYELSRKLDAPVRLQFDGYPKDMVSRAQVFAKLMAAEGITVAQALEISGLIEDGRQNG